jgi:hypothetical protein
LLALYTMTCSLVAVPSAEGRANLTVAPVAVMDDTVTLVGAWNTGVYLALSANTSFPADPVSSAIVTASASKVAVAAAAATQCFFMHSIKPRIRVFRKRS